MNSNEIIKNLAKLRTELKPDSNWKKQLRSELVSDFGPGGGSKGPSSGGSSGSSLKNSILSMTKVYISVFSVVLVGVLFYKNILIPSNVEVLSSEEKMSLEVKGIESTPTPTLEAIAALLPTPTYLPTPTPTSVPNNDPPPGNDPLPVPPSPTPTPTPTPSPSPTPTPIPMADLSLVKTVNEPQPCLNELIDFTITVLNSGPDDATGVEVRDQLPNGYSWIEDDGGGSYDIVSGVWAVGPIAASSSATLNIKVQVVGDVTTFNYENWAQITASNLPDPDSDPNSDELVDDLGDGILPDDDESNIITYPDPRPYPACHQVI